MEKKEFEKKIEETVLTEVPELKRRVSVIEQTQTNFLNLHEKVVLSEHKINAISLEVKSIKTSMAQMKEDTEKAFINIRSDFVEFTEKIKESTTGFIRWLLSSIFLSLIIGLFCQYTAFHGAYESINNTNLTVEKIKLRLDSLRIVDQVKGD